MPNEPPMCERLPEVVYSTNWSRPRRLAMTGPQNPRYRHGRYSQWRRFHLEKPLNASERALTPHGLYQLHLRISRLPAVWEREQARARLDALADLRPDHWALRDPRSPDPRWYVPRRSWSLCVRYLRAVQRLFSFVLRRSALILSSIPTPFRRDSRDNKNESRSQTLVEQTTRLKAKAEAEKARYAEWCKQNGINWP